MAWRANGSDGLHGHSRPRPLEGIGRIGAAPRQVANERSHVDGEKAFMAPPMANMRTGSLRQWMFGRGGPTRKSSAVRRA